MRRKARTFIGLKHAIAERVLLGHLEVRLRLCRIHIKKLRVGRTRWDETSDFNPVRSMHGSGIVLGKEIRMCVPQVVANTQRTRIQGNRLARGVSPAASDVSPGGDQDRILKQVVGSSVLLKHDDDVLNLGVDIWVGKGIALVTAVCREEKDGTSRSEQEQAEQRASVHGGTSSSFGGSRSSSNEHRTIDFHSHFRNFLTHTVGIQGLIFVSRWRTLSAKA